MALVALHFDCCLVAAHYCTALCCAVLCTGFYDIDYTLQPMVRAEENAGGEQDAGGDANAAGGGTWRSLGRRFTLLRQTFRSSIPHRFSLRRTSRLPSAAAAAVMAAAAATRLRGDGVGSGSGAASTSPSLVSPMSPVGSARGRERQCGDKAAADGGGETGSRHSHRTPMSPASERVQRASGGESDSSPPAHSRYSQSTNAQLTTASALRAHANTTQCATAGDGELRAIHLLGGSWRRKRLENSHISPLSPPSAAASLLNSMDCSFVRCILYVYTTVRTTSKLSISPAVFVMIK